MICLENLHHRILEIPDLCLEEGTTAVIGPNGAGKSTLLRLCAGVEEAAQGSVLIDGTIPRSTNIGWVDENPERTLLFERVSDEIASTLRFQGIPCPETENQVRTIIEKLGISALLTSPSWHLSAGEKVLVALGAALAGKPRVLILDEVDSHLDPMTESRIHGILRESGIPYLLLCTQHMEAAAAADWVVYLEGGRVLRCGFPQEVFSHLKNTCFYPQSWRESR
ncbi:MAG: energy-coupling factor ABC transporter ATP-binding protein [Methanomicrobiales archaeon]|nr:energy-coupling factor ABC transporter ATP-binding protein [Methanomicrobiales archaeon]